MTIGVEDRRTASGVCGEIRVAGPGPSGREPILRSMDFAPASKAGCTGLGSSVGWAGDGRPAWARAFYVSDVDWERLEALLARARTLAHLGQERLRVLSEALDRALVVGCNEVPPDVVTMNAQVRLRDEDAGTDMVLSLVYPECADLRSGKVSILTPIGAALLGSRVGDTVNWRACGRCRRLRIERVIYQPKWSWL